MLEVKAYSFTKTSIPIARILLVSFLKRILLLYMIYKLKKMFHSACLALYFWQHNQLGRIENYGLFNVSKNNIFLFLYFEKKI